MDQENPILNNPYLEPHLHYNTDSKGYLDYGDIRQGRRIYKTDAAVIPTRQRGTKQIFEWNEDPEGYDSHLINLLRREVSLWRAEGYPKTTRITRQLLTFWFSNPERLVTKRLFFAQQEAVETAVWLNEVAEKSSAGPHILNMLRHGQHTVSEAKDDILPRIAFKMATGTGKTVVMACLICYHFFNRQEYRNDTRFADYFLVVAPGITIKSRLGVLFVDNKTKNPRDAEDYYRMRGLIPQHLEHRLQNLNARLVITNYHNFEPKILQGNKRSPFDGKVDLEGNKTDTGNKEDFSQVMKRVMGNFKPGSRLLVLNDEAHHCYLPRTAGKPAVGEEAEENARAAVWFSGLRELAKRFRMQAVYDLSATPYYLTGSGHAAYSLFPWVVSDFSLIEAIESGLVKIPFLPEMDDTQELEQPVLRNLYEHVRDELPRKGQRAQKKAAAEEGTLVSEPPPKIPPLVKMALDAFYRHYTEYYQGMRLHAESRADIFSAPPVFIAVCNNTSVSKEVYKYIAGYEYADAEGELHTVQGAKDLFSNYDPVTARPLKRPPTLLIDSAALENAGQVNEDFKKIFAGELEEFKKDYARIHGQGSAEKITDAEILREVVNTVGQQGKLGAHIRCVVSVSMLTEGWDANTVTHIMGLRAFGSQLLCEQVAGRALRRMSYILKTYRRDTGEEVAAKDIHRYKPENLIEKYPPEYAHIIGVPFRLFKGGKTGTPPPPVEMTHIAPIHARQAKMEIVFPNVTGYRLEAGSADLQYDFSTIENYEIDGSRIPTETVMASPISPNQEKLKVQHVLERRDQELIYLLTKSLIKYHFSDDEGRPQFQKFNRLKEIVAHWYENKVLVVGKGQEYRKLLYFEEEKKIADHIARGINTHLNTEEHIRPIFNYYNKFSSTKYVNGNTVKEVFPTEKSHINYVVMDSDWEGICAKVLEELEAVQCYVKNQFLGFAIPYVKDGKERQYFTDFIARVKTPQGTVRNLMIEISGMSQDKAEKKWYVENRWLPAVNAMREKYDYPEWAFIEISNDIRDIRNQLTEKINNL